MRRDTDKRAEHTEKGGNKGPGVLDSISFFQSPMLYNPQEIIKIRVPFEDGIKWESESKFI